jgi:hypothetical protein
MRCSPSVAHLSMRVVPRCRWTPRQRHSSRRGRAHHAPRHDGELLATDPDVHRHRERRGAGVGVARGTYFDADPPGRRGRGARRAAVIIRATLRCLYRRGSVSLCIPCCCTSTIFRAHVGSDHDDGGSSSTPRPAGPAFRERGERGTRVLRSRRYWANVPIAPDLDGVRAERGLQMGNAPAPGRGSSCSRPAPAARAPTDLRTKDDRHLNIAVRRRREMILRGVQDELHSITDLT